MLKHVSNKVLDWPRPRNVHDEGCDEAAQVEALVKSVGKYWEIGLGVLAELQRHEGSSQRGHRDRQRSAARRRNAGNETRPANATGESPRHTALRCRSGLKTQGSTCRTGTGSSGWTSGLPNCRRDQITASLAHRTSLLRQVSNQVVYCLK